MASKGKGIAAKDSPGKRKRVDNDKAGGGKRKNRDVLQFFEDAAYERDGSDSSFDIDDLFEDDDFLDEFDSEPKVKSEPGRSEQVRLFPKEEELSGDELEKMLEERYKSGSGYVRYAEDDYDNKRSVDRSFLIPSVMEPTIWKVKCKVGRERHTVFCLMQKYVDLKVLGTKLQIISAFAVEHIKGFVFIEADKQSNVAEACNQLADVYFSLVTKVPTNEVSQLLVVRQRYNEVKEGTWARVKNGIYRGDIAQVVAVNNERKRATVKLIPRVDMQALTAKYGGGGTIVKKAKGAVPAARLISSSELEEFRPLMQCRRDRDTGKVYEFLDGLMLKDGFLYKKVSIDSLSFWDVNPTEEELQKFTLPSNDESDNMEWLSQLYGEQKKKCNVMINKGGGKGEGSSGSNEQSSFEVHDLVLFGKRDFGIVIGMEKDETYKIMKYGSEGPVTMTLGQKDLKYVPLDKKFTALDLHMKTISINDTVRILHGPTKDRHGTVKQIYRGIIFLYDENDFENAYFCAKSQESEKVKHIDSTSCGKVEEAPSGFEDVPSSPQSPLAKKPWQMREDERRDKDGMFSVGQSLRIRIGPLKGYLCRVLAVRFSDVTVKLDSKQKVLTVKSEHLSEVRAKSSTTSMSDDTGLNSSFKPFDLLGSDGNTNDWLQGASGSAEGDGWNVGGPSGERSAWPAFSSAGASTQVGTSAGVLPSSVDNDSGKVVEDDAWLSKVNNNQNSSWGASGHDKAAGSSDQVGGWGKSSGTGGSSSWEGAKVPGEDHGGSWKLGSSMDQGKEDTSGQADTWNLGKKVLNETSSWGKQSTDKGPIDAWEKGKESLEKSAGKPGGDAWGEAKGNNDPAEDSWGKGVGKWGAKNNSNENSEWKSPVAAPESQARGWGQPQGQGIGGDAKGSGDSAETSWGKATDKWGNKNNSANESNNWKSSAALSESQSGGWGQNASGGWKNNSSDEQSSDRLGKIENPSNCGQGGKSIQGEQSWNNYKAEGTNSWDQSRRGENDQGYRGHGSGGRRGRGGNRGGRDQSGRGRGGSFDRGSWNQENQFGSTLGGSVDGNKGWSSDTGREGKGWGKLDWTQGSCGPADGKGLNSADPPFKRSNDSGSWNQQTSWEKAKSGDVDNSTWGKSTACQNKDFGDEPWAKAKNSEDKVTDDPWGKVANKWGNTGNSSKRKEWGSSSNTPFDSKDSTLAQEENTGGGWKNGGGGWKSSGDSGQAKMDSWGKPKSFGGEGAATWDRSGGGNESWERSKSFENDTGGGFSGGRGSGGRRGGRGHDQFGRGRGRSFDRGGNSSSWGKDSNQETGVGGGSWSKDQGGSAAWGSSSWNKDQGREAEIRGGSWSKDQGGSSWGNPSSGKSWSGNGGGDNKWGNTGNSSRSKEWGSSANTPCEEENSGGGWKNTGGGWKSSEDNGQEKIESWGKPKSFGGEGATWDRSGGNESWGQSNDRGGFSGGRGGRRGGRGRGDQFGRGRGRSFDRGGNSSSSWGKDTSQEAAGVGGGSSSWSKDQGGSSSWGNASSGKSWSSDNGGGGGDNKGWNNNNHQGQGEKNAVGGGGWNNPSETQSQGGSTDRSNNQTSSWGKAKGWNDKESAGNNGGPGGNTAQGGSSWGGGGNGQSRGWGEQDKGGSKPSEGAVSSWGAGKTNDQGSGGGWGKSNDKESAGNNGGSSSSWRNPSGGNTGQGGSSWGGSSSGRNGQSRGWGNSGDEDKGRSKPSEGGVSSWGKGNDQGSGGGGDGGGGGKSTGGGGGGGGGGWA